jgi:hypothetical protein
MSQETKATYSETRTKSETETEHEEGDNLTIMKYLNGVKALENKTDGDLDYKKLAKMIVEEMIENCKSNDSNKRQSELKAY